MSFPFENPGLAHRWIAQLRLWLWLALAGAMLAIIRYCPELPAILGLPLFFSAVGLYSEYCPHCGLLIWARGSEIKDNILSPGPFWIPRKCTRCGSA